VALITTDVKEECIAYIIKVTKIGELGATLSVYSIYFFLLSVLPLLVTAKVHILPTLVTLMVEAIRSSKRSVLTRATWRKTPEDGILHGHGSETLKSYIALTDWVSKSKAIPVTGRGGV
jgi:hypothetical protein